MNIGMKIRKIENEDIANKAKLILENFADVKLREIIKMQVDVTFSYKSLIEWI